MADRGGDYSYSTLEVAGEAAHVRSGQYPEAVRPADSQYPEAVRPADSQYPEAVPPPARGFYKDTPLPAHSPYPAVKVEHPTDPGNGATDGRKGARICGIRRKPFWILMGVGLIAIIGLAVGLGVGLRSKSGSADENGKDENGQDENGNGNGTSPSSSGLHATTRLATANFTDTEGHDTFLVVYQLWDSSIGISTFNTGKNKWIPSIIKNGSAASFDVPTSLAISAKWDSDGEPPAVNIYYQTDNSPPEVSGFQLAKFPAKLATYPDDWENLGSVNQFYSNPGSTVTAYDLQCDVCIKETHIFWQDVSGLYQSEKGKPPQRIDMDVQLAENTSIALTYSPTNNLDDQSVTRRSLDLFFRSSEEDLVHLLMSNGSNMTRNVGRKVGAQTNIAAFSTGFNESKPEENPTPVGIQVLTIDPGTDDGVQLSYLRDNEWTVVSSEVTDLADCRERATMTVNRAQRLYCLVETDGDLGIVEFRWQGDLNDPDTYLRWERVGDVDLGL
ncbi:hypothetical protein GGS20DRAFT_444458 [Poronia punctata]|nr:hypothetical protein GGS20DRAFT_444458 [Poronia punctata]